MKNIFILFFILFIFSSCQKDRADIFLENNGNIQFVFNHKVGLDSLHRYWLQYQNNAGNQYEVDELKYFISDVILYSDKGMEFKIDWPSIHYVDLDIPSTLVWDVEKAIPAKTFDSITFTFGLSEEKNLSNYFVNAPEINMFWPEVLGGGYHYMMFNGKWQKPDNTLSGFNLHLGKGQVYSGSTQNTDSIIGFVNNCFKVSLPTSSFKVYKNKTTQINLLMDINKWFSQPNIYDLNYWGNAIMQNQAAMHAVKENGKHVFSVLSTP